MWQAWINGILGAWLFIEGLIHFTRGFTLWDNLIVGIIVAILGFSMVNKKAWQGWLCGIVGVWLIIAAFIPGLLTGGGHLWNGIITGVLVMIGGFGALGGGGQRVAHAH